MRNALTNRRTAGKLRILLYALGCVLLASGGGMELADYPFRPANPPVAQTSDPSPPSAVKVAADPLPVSPIPNESTATPCPGNTPLPSPTPVQREYADGEAIGSISIPRLNLSTAIVEGSGNAELLLGVGHVQGSALPGARGHVVLAGHRVTRRMHPFRHLELLQPEDAVMIEFEGTLYTYSVIERFIVKQDETWVLDAFDEAHDALTLITCHPPGSLRKRMIVRARLMESDSNLGQEQGEENHE